MGISGLVTLCAIVVIFNIVLAFEVIALKKQVRAVGLVNKRLGVELATVRGKLHKLDVNLIENNHLLNVINSRGKA